jgi:hypothetical protein
LALQAKHHDVRQMQNVLNPEERNRSLPRLGGIVVFLVVIFVVVVVEIVAPARAARSCRRALRTSAACIPLVLVVEFVFSSSNRHPPWRNGTRLRVRRFRGGREEPARFRFGFELWRNTGRRVRPAGGLRMQAKRRSGAACSARRM